MMISRMFRKQLEFNKEKVEYVIHAGDYIFQE